MRSQVKSGYRLPLHPFALRFFEHYRMVPGQLVPNGWRKLAGLIYLRGPKSNKGWHSRYFFVGRLDKGELPFDRNWNPYCKDFENPGKPIPNNLTKHILSHIKLRGGLSIDELISEEQLEWAKIIPPKPIPASLSIPHPPPAIPSVSSTKTVLLEMASGSGKLPQGGFLGVLQKAKGKQKEKQLSVELLPPALKKTRVTPPERSPQILEQVSIDDDPIFLPRWTLRRDALGGQIARSLSSIFFMEMFFETRRSSRIRLTRPLHVSFAQAVYMEAQEVIHRAEELSKQEADHLAQIATLEKRLERGKRKAAEEVTKAQDQGIRDFLDGNAGDKWLKKRTEDGLEIYELGFVKAKEMFAEHFPDIPLDDFILPAVVSPSGETAMP
ncbi:hypothetical protein RJ640_012716 [Escallonia rubra]|uniref:Transposase (putative) gypsy type domain-containing protein n=1 Tax=Escallonia rubra TaxID=112253 RepID=A0AA88UKN2_9ASTE|nr:hypothetical protein RJ640_012716 [Escallonia rubra]